VLTKRRLSITGRIRGFGRLPSPHLGRRYAIKSRRSVEPNSRELQIGFAHFVRVCLAGPFNAFFGHGAVLRGPSHGNAPIPKRGDLADELCRRRDRCGKERAKRRSILWLTFEQADFPLPGLRYRYDFEGLIDLLRPLKRSILRARVEG
jgi:hypothetical protein